ncbi:ORF_11 [Adoxophyes orana granulovirus]|uniref:ORF_11 n=1 Tax=Adoxophyes orana granulovirus TaxID=170617 RepID=Q7TA04_GVAO|nr:ORF_11 [Adoxophyes orana granulovirus]AAP85648.1 ORF_11 [Adoxophyes orana granulovirus]
MDLSDELLPLAFAHLYFDIKESDVVSDVEEYINNSENYLKIINYIQSIRLRNVVSDFTEDMFEYVTPQFRFVCERDYNLDIVKIKNHKFFIPKGASVYATNLLVSDVDKAMMEIFKLTNLIDKTKTVNVSKKYCVSTDNSEGVLFARPYLDWMGLKVCEGATYNQDDYYRLYVVGEQLAYRLLNAKLNLNSLNLEDKGVLKNFYKGLPLRRTANSKHVKTEKRFVTDNCDVVFDRFANEFMQGGNEIHFVQRDYIFDALSFPEDLLEELQNNWTTDTSLHKLVINFKRHESVQLHDTQTVIDRYSITNYKIMQVSMQDYKLPNSNSAQSVDYLFIPSNVYQIRHTLNSAFMPSLGLVILAKHAFFGSRRVLDFEPNEDLFNFVKNKTAINEKNRFYHLGGSYFLEETYFTLNEIPIYVVVRIDNDLILRHNLISNSFDLKQLKHNWVYNSILNLFVRKH